MSKWTDKVECENSAKAQVVKDEFRRKGMIARIRRRKARYVNGIAYGGVWVVEARMRRSGAYHYRTNDLPPMVLVDVPTLVENKRMVKKLGVNGKPEKDFRGRWVMEEKVDKSVVMQPKALRLNPDEVAEYVAEQQEKVNAKMES